MTIKNNLSFIPIYVRYRLYENVHANVTMFLLQLEPNAELFCRLYFLILNFVNISSIAQLYCN